MGTYLTDDEIDFLRGELALHYALPWAADMAGTAWEQMLADAKGGTWSGQRGNRPDPDVIVPEGRELIRYSVKTEGLTCTRERNCAQRFLGYREDFIMARPKVDELLTGDESFGSLSADELGSRVLSYFNERTVQAYEWHAVAFMLRVRPTTTLRLLEFIYWEERPPPLYDPSGYWWVDTGRATGTNRNIAGFPNDIPRSTTPNVASTFRWTSGGKQLYAVHRIPVDADIIAVDVTELTKVEAKEALLEAIERKVARERSDPRVREQAETVDEIVARADEDR